MTEQRRVIAIESITNEEARIYGYGNYVGDEILPPGIQLWGCDLNELGHTNPKIVLDNGKVVWGCECWWGNATRMEDLLTGKKIVEVDIEEARKRSNESYKTHK